MFMFSICIITAEPVAYGFYVCFKLLMSHVLPVTIVFITLIKPQTRTAKRFSTLFLGEGNFYDCYYILKIWAQSAHF